jgi:hypothetical protein
VNESQQSFGFAVGAAEGDGDGVIFVDDVNGVFVLSSLLFACRSGLKILLTPLHCESISMKVIKLLA